MTQYPTHLKFALPRSVRRTHNRHNDSSTTTDNFSRARLNRHLVVDPLEQDLNSDERGGRAIRFIVVGDEARRHAGRSRLIYESGCRDSNPGPLDPQT